MSTLYFVKTVKAESDSVEVHIAKRDDGYRSPAGQFPTAFSLAERTHGVFVVGSGGDLYLIKNRKAESGRVEVHRLTASSAYKQFDIQTATIFELKDTDNGTWTEDKGNLFLIKTRNCESRLIEVHRSPGKSFSGYSLQVAVPISQTEADNGVWDIYNNELFFIKFRNTQFGKVELWRVSGSDLQTVTRYQTWFQDSDGEQGSWRIGAGGDLYFIKTRNCDSGKIEVHIASAKYGYQEVSHHATWIDQNDEPLGTWLIA
jgi:hypothetical protein